MPFVARQKNSDALSSRRRDPSAEQVAHCLVDARKLRELIGGEQATKPPVVVPTVTSPACPSCGGHMLERTVKKGPNSGNRFWGCAQYPKCKGIRS